MSVSDPFQAGRANVFGVVSSSSGRFYTHRSFLPFFVWLLVTKTCSAANSGGYLAQGFPSDLLAAAEKMKYVHPLARSAEETQGMRRIHAPQSRFFFCVNCECARTFFPMLTIYIYVYTLPSEGGIFYTGS